MEDEVLKFGRCGLCNIDFKSNDELKEHFTSELHSGNIKDERLCEITVAISLLKNNEQPIKKTLKEYIYNTIVSYSLYCDGMPLSYANENKRHELHDEIATRIGLNYSDKVFHIFWELENYTSLETRKEEDEEYVRRNMERVNQITNEAYIALLKELEKETNQGD